MKNFIFYNLTVHIIWNNEIVKKYIYIYLHIKVINIVIKTA